MRRWLKYMLRKSFAPKSVDYAEKRRQKLATLYCFCAWNCCCVGVYLALKENYPMTDKEQKQPGRYYARLIQSGDIQVINMRGFKFTDEYNIEDVPKLDPNEEELEKTIEELPDVAKPLNS